MEKLGAPFNSAKKEAPMALRRLIYCFWMLAVLFISCEKDRSEIVQKEHEIQSSMEAYTKVFNAKDSAALANLWDEDATLQNPITGDLVEGRSNIENYFKQKFEEHPKSKLTIIVEKVEFPATDEAIVKAHIQIADADSVNVEGRKLIDLVKEEGKWLIVNSSDYEQLPIVSHYDNLEKINWLVGRWADDADNIDITSEWKWDKHKNFLTERFTMKVLDQDDFEGFQILGWDPASETIHSWVFDVDGGFGDGSLINEDNSWYASMKYTQPDGKIASSTNIYTKVDDNTYTFASVGRDIDGTVLPNVGPFKIIRKK
ncbi:MAG TPA: SgcJ/EcaC family oxidoreductase [Parachlamydiaceae bacterium]|nr:SgcJ/EcaC family oxidoreductase [Parachlamydiaceae bacterium]